MTGHLDSIVFASAGAAFDRAGHRRAEAEALAARPDARLVALSDGRIAVDLAGPAKTLAWRPVPARAPGSPRIFLGMIGETPCFAADYGPLEEADTADLLPEGGKFIDLRSISPELSALEAGIAATAKAVLGWHSTHRFCARCGAGPTLVEDGGWRRRCAACGAMHFPRVDPVVIMLVLHGDRVLLGRQSNWPAGMHSLLAGFVEPGETPEDAVRREVMEEAAIRVGRVRYLATQPWPFPSTLMIGCIAEALSEEITIDPTELESALWLPRGEAIEALAGRHPVLAAPRRDAIARSILLEWVEGGLEGF
ncbi:MAG: NAD(+) diphosphatase [Pseudomonadota bacterium]